MLIGARNDHVRSALRRNYQSKTPGDHLNVFCVSNKLYEENRDSETVTISGIPEVRQFCRSITADAQLLDAQNFLDNSLPDLIATAKIWATRQKWENRDKERMEKIREKKEMIYEVFDQLVSTDGDSSSKDTDTSKRLGPRYR